MLSCDSVLGVGLWGRALGEVRRLVNLRENSSQRTIQELCLPAGEVQIWRL